MVHQNKRILIVAGYLQQKHSGPISNITSGFLNLVNTWSIVTVAAS